MEAFKGKYERISVENLDEFLKEMGVKTVILYLISEDKNVLSFEVSYMLRKAATASSPVVEISGSPDGVWSITTSTILKTHKLTFKVRKDR